MTIYDSISTTTEPDVSSSEYLELLEKLGDPVSVIAGTRIVYVNQAYVEMLEYTQRENVAGRDFGDLLEASVDLTSLQHCAVDKAGPEFGEFTLVGKNRKHVVQVRSIQVRYRGELAVLTIARDVTIRKQTEDQLKMTLSLLEATLEATADGISTVALDGTIINHNRRFLELMGLTENALEVRRRDQELFVDTFSKSTTNPEAFRVGVKKVYEHPDKTTHDIIEFLDGRVIERYTFPQKVGGEIVGIVWSLRDITQRRRLEALLQHHASHDHLTDLLNRRGFEEALKKQLEAAMERPESGALFLLDLDQFKDINDSLGHPAGDEMLTALAELLKRALPDDAVIGRLGGDEFGIILPGAGAHRAEMTVQQVLSALSHRVFETVTGDRVRLTCSLGVVLYPLHGSTVEQLMSRVDLALYSAKEKGRNRFMVYSPIERRAKKSETRLSMRWAIRDSLDNGRMALDAQPIVNLANDSIEQYELLLRLPLADGHLLAAGQFIGLAERSGLIQAIDQWVINNAIQLLKRSEGQPFSLAVNLSGTAFEDAQLLSAIQGSLRGIAIEPSRIVFEVTETAAVSNVSGALKFMTSLKEIGCRFAIDDFGVGFSSLTQLKHLPVDYLKIDGSFIRHIRTSTVDQEVVKAMVAIAGALGMRTVAESVRSAADVELLKRLGVHYAQGYYIGRPRPVDRVFGAGPRIRVA